MHFTGWFLIKVDKKKLSNWFVKIGPKGEDITRVLVYDYCESYFLLMLPTNLMRYRYSGTEH